MGNRLLVARDEISGRVARYDYDEVDNLISAEYERGGEVERLYRVSDRMGNLFETRERDDRRYDAGGRLAEDREHFYHYDCEGNLVFKEFKEMVLHGGIVAPINKERLETELGIRFRAFGTGWRYDWQSDGMLSRVVRPDGKEVSFAYDALGRRTEKTYEGVTTHFVWDGNVPLHEWQEVSSDTEKTNITTWLFEQDTFIPAAKLAGNGESFSIVSDYLGTPLQAFDNNGNKVWEQELDIYGRQRKRPSSFIPFKYQGQYADKETGLYYNRFRYYAPRTGAYISQDPIRLKGNNPTLYGYVGDCNKWTDMFGLDMLALPAPTGKNPWGSGEIVSTTIPKGGLDVEMAMSPGQTRPGGWVTTDKITDVDFVRNKLAVTPEFKPEISHVQKFHIPEGVRVQIGTVGPQTYNGIIYEGRGNQIQILNFEDRAKLEPIGKPRKISYK